MFLEPLKNRIVDFAKDEFICSTKIVVLKSSAQSVLVSIIRALPVYLHFIV